MPVFDSPKYTVEQAIEEIKKETNVIFLDFHAEATAEKICYAKYFSELGVSVFAGTHTHVQTADERIINNQTAYISDVGFCGDNEGVIGMDYESSAHHLMTMLPGRFEVGTSDRACINGIVVTVDVLSGRAEDIKRINVIKEL